MTTIRPATVSDAELLSQIGGRSLIESHGHSAPAEIMEAYRTEKFTTEALLEELEDTANIFHIIYHDENPAGYSKIIYREPLPNVAQKNITKLERLYLLSEYYSLKLGHQLLEFNIELSKKEGEAGMWLYVWKGNERALRFYERWGFQVIGDGWFRLTDEHANPNWQMMLEYREI